MTYQRMLLRFLSNGPLGSLGRRCLRNRVWTVEDGKGAGLRLRFPQNLDYISGTSELPVQEVLVQRLRSGEVFYDIGANMGFFSLVAARQVGSNGCAYAFEPVAENAAFVRENARLNCLENLKLFELAVGRASGRAELLLTDWDGGASLASSEVKPSKPVARRSVRVVALDDFISAERLRMPNFVKIDVEGVELAVLQGMTGTIAAARPVLLYEVDDGNRESFDRRWAELDDFVSGLGYEIIHLEDSYPTLHWNVGHSLALPREIMGAN
jgi:FkbM family methyltransferase